MPSNQRNFRLGKKNVSVAEFGKIVSDEYKRRQDEQLNLIADMYERELNNLINELKAKSSNRGRGFYAVRYNNPFGDAKVVKVKTPRGYNISVDNKQFNILDQGVKEEKRNSQSKPIKFPRYKGNLTNPRAVTNSNKIFSNIQSVTAVAPSPFIVNGVVKILDRKVLNSVSFKKGDSASDIHFAVVASNFRQGGWVTIKPHGRITLKRIVARNFYRGVMELVNTAFGIGTSNKLFVTNIEKAK